ncbi:MAG TPA: hypothetical protein VGN16_03425 [Acidobacteriaceae bacterium]
MEIAIGVCFYLLQNVFFTDRVGAIGRATNHLDEGVAYWTTRWIHDYAGQPAGMHRA